MTMIDSYATFKVTNEHRAWFFENFGWMAEDSWIKMTYLKENRE